MTISILLFFYTWFLHPLHLSVSDIKLNEKNHSLEISQRLFVDDLENALAAELGAKTDILNPKNPELLSKAIGDYVLRNLHISLDNKVVNPRYLGYELEEDVVWVYLEAPNVHHPKSLTIRNTIFFESFEDQLNLINLKTRDGIRSIKLEPDKKTGTLRF